MSLATILLSEAVGTAILILLGTGVVANNRLMPGIAGLTAGVLLPA